MDQLLATTTPELLPDFEADWVKNVPYRFAGLRIVIEYLAGDERVKVKHGGTIIKGIMPAAYGYILGTTDAHGEEIDMYLAPSPYEAAQIYVIDQVDPGTGIFDEHKVMLGFGTMDEAIHTYISVFGDGLGEKRLGDVVTFTVDELLAWLRTEGSSLKAASDNCAKELVHTVSGVRHVPATPKDLPAPRDEVGGVEIALEDLSRGPKIKTLADGKGGFDHHIYLYSALDIETWSNATDTMCRLMDLATEADTVHFHECSPGGSVILMGRIVSAIYRTKAKVITYAEGAVASAATAIWAAGHERHIFPGAYFMQHMSSQLLVGKTTNIASKAAFGVDYINEQLKDLVEIGLFTQEEVDGMSEGSFDIFISGRDAIARIGQITYRA